MNKTEEIKAALESAQRFIKNGVEFGYIRMPDADTPDPAHNTPKLIENAIAALSASAEQQPVSALTDEREAFEKHFSGGKHEVRRDERGRYVLPSAQYAWHAWQARASLSATSQPSAWNEAQAEVTWMDVAGEHEGRYRVEHRAFGCFDVKCGTGTRTLYSTKFGRRDAELVAAELTTAFHDGIHVAIRALRQQAPAVQEEAAPQGLPQKIVVGVHALSKVYAEGWNDCIDEMAASHPAPAQTGEKK